MSPLTIAILGVLGLQLLVVFGFVLLERRQPSATLAWILGVLFLPILGVVVYWVFGLRRRFTRSRRAERIATRAREAYAPHRAKALGLHRAAGRLIPESLPVAALGDRAADCPATTGNHVQMMVNAEVTYAAIHEAIAAAKRHIHVSFYIVQPDAVGERLREALIARAEAGVEVRVMCDAVGSMKLPSGFWRGLINAGGQARFYSPVRLAPLFRRRDAINLRNHRKIVVVDGARGFTGGINVGREYLGLDPEVGDWRDSHIAITGPAVVGLQQTFIEDWLIASGELLDDADYFDIADTSDVASEPVGAGGRTPSDTDRNVSADAAGDAIVQVVASGPDRPWTLIHRMHIQAISGARRRVWITNPYFVPDRVMQQTLVTAALRGVDVQLLVPSRSDSHLVDWASRSYFPELIEAGVRVLTYAKGFLHAKSMVVDDWFGTLGSANMDVRSFHLNYELNAFVYERAFVSDLAAQFREDADGAAELDLGWVTGISYGRRLLYASAGLLSPLL